MKKAISLLLAAFLLTGCSSNTVAEVTTETTVPTEETPLFFSGTITQDNAEIEYVSRFSSETVITLSDEGITVNGGGETDTVYTSRDIIYYEDRDAYDSGNPYGEGTDADKHTAEEAAAHTVVNITAPGAYRVSGNLSAGQIRVDLGDAAYFDSEAVVELILDGADVTCTVAPAILFLNTYECDGNWSVDQAQAEVDTAEAGANLILQGENTVSGSYVARIYKDASGEKKLWKQDGAVYSYMTLNVYGPGSLDITADNEGLNSELHLTVNGGDISIRSGNDGINTNEDGVSVTTINGGTLHIIAGLGEEGDGIDSNGYLVINGGTVVASANPAADAGLDSDLGSYVNGGTVIALGSTMDWTESNSDQVTMNLRFADFQSSGSAVVVTKTDGTVLFAYDPSEDEVLGENVRQYMGAVISCPDFAQSETYYVWLDGVLTGEETSGVYTSVSAYENGVQMGYSGAEAAMGGFGGGRGQMGGMGQPGEGFDGEMPDRESFEEARKDFGGELPEDFDPSQMENFTLPEGETMPEDFDPSQMGGGRGQRPDGDEMQNMTPPDRENFPEGEMPQGGREMPSGEETGELSTEFYMSDKVNAFSGVSAA